MQVKYPTRGDWASTVKKLIEIYNLQLDIPDIQNTRQSIFKDIVKKKVEKVAFKTLMEKQQAGKKGKLLKYDKLELTDYLLPDCDITVEEKQEMFSIRTEMNDIPCNFGNKTDCEMGCKQLLNSEHMLTCLVINEEKTTLKYEHILKGSMQQKVMILRKIQLNEEKKKKIQELRDSVNIV